MRRKDEDLLIRERAQSSFTVTEHHTSCSHLSQIHSQLLNFRNTLCIPEGLFVVVVIRFTPLAVDMIVAHQPKVPLRPGPRLTDMFSHSETQAYYYSTTHNRCFTS